VLSTRSGQRLRLAGIDSAHRILLDCGLTEFRVDVIPEIRGKKPDDTTRRYRSRERSERRRGARDNSRSFYDEAVAAKSGLPIEVVTAWLARIHPRSVRTSRADWQAEAGFIAWYRRLYTRVGHKHSMASAAYLFNQVYGPFENLEDALATCSRNHEIAHDSRFAAAMEDEILLNRSGRSEGPALKTTKMSPAGAA